jgi:hypothetical protein
MVVMERGQLRQDGWLEDPVVGGIFLCQAERRHVLTETKSSSATGRCSCGVYVQLLALGFIATLLVGFSV